MGLRELNVDLTKDHVALWNSTKKFMKEVWRPAAIALDRLPNPEDVIRKDSVLWDVLRQSFELGYHSMFFPEEFGGTNLDPLSVGLVSELMGWAAPDLAVSLGVCTTPFLWNMLSPHEEMHELTRKFCADTKGEMTGCWAITEPDHGSDWILFDADVPQGESVAPSVRAALDGDHYVINGTKAAWVSNGTIAKYAALFLSLDPSSGMAGGGVACVPLDLPGVTRGKPLNKIGQRALNQGEIYFDNVRIPKNMMIAADPVTFKLLANSQLGLANGFMGLIFTGCAQAAFEEALEFALTRIQGGKPIYEHQNIKLKLFDMFASVEAARALARRVGLYNKVQAENMQPVAVHYAMASKIMATETAFNVANQAVQVCGGSGLSKEYLIEKIFRDARAALIEDGCNEVLALDGADRIRRGRTHWAVQEGLAQPGAAAGAAAGMTWEDIRPMMRPEPGTVHMGRMEADPEKCTHCGLCVLNCPFRAWETDENEVPRMKEVYECFSCYNCMVACPVGAISIVEPYHVDSGFYKTEPGPLPARMPYEPRDAKGNPAEWNHVEKLMFERRSVRNFKETPVPETLIRRVLEAGRFAPSGGNCQPWQFVVVTDKALIQELNDACYSILSMLHTTYMNDQMVKGLVPVYAQNPNPGFFDPRVIVGGMGSITKKNAPTFLDAPVVILMACDERAIGGPQIAAGIAGQNMNLAAMSLGLGFCWIGFSQVIEMVPHVKEKLGLKDPWKITTAMVLGYPKFKQEGIVPREFRPITWFREGAKGPEIER
jgi:alkylation response protein AidB-like acyl-CoA dehydrogenase/nitroreductase/NAD-dependent dihydropyrimidine dehydrogenase PreA subunit